uniref:VASt domain-containing protein n=1 Tax=Ditylum brightwellii TaxID=49249 RepID=A0A6U3S138_9STRA|mmetsp:Transcript_31359/g.46816  ORF Transcript_31359/g.46816 Transcript_31359/m.46816 type:complete len:737 (+) Transcript_31359:224-2434(+)
MSPYSTNLMEMRPPPPSRRRHPVDENNTNDGHDEEKSTATSVTDALDSVRRMAMTFLSDADLDKLCGRATCCGRAVNSANHLYNNNRGSSRATFSQEHQMNAIRRHYFPPLTNVIVKCESFEHCDAKTFLKFHFGSEQIKKFHMERGDQDITVPRWKPWRGHQWRQQHQREMESIELSTITSSPSIISKNMPMHVLWSRPVLERTITFRTPVNVPMGPKYSEVSMLQRVLRVEEEMYVIESSMRLLDVPFSKRFHIVIRQTIETNRLSQRRREGANEEKKTKRKNKKGRELYGCHDDIRNLQSTPLFSRGGVQKQQQRMNGLRPPDLQPVSSDESEDDNTEEEIEEFQLVPPVPSATALCVEFEIRFTKQCKFEDQIRHGLTKKIRRLLASWCRRTQKEWNESTNESPPLSPASRTSDVPSMKHGEIALLSLPTTSCAPPVPIPTVPRDSVKFSERKQQRRVCLSQGELVADDEKKEPTTPPPTKWQPLHDNRHHDRGSLIWSMTDIDIDEHEDLHDLQDDDSATAQRQNHQEDVESDHDNNFHSNEFKLMEWRSDALSEISAKDICNWDDLERYDGGEGYGVEIYDRGDNEEGEIIQSQEDETGYLDMSHFDWNTSIHDNSEFILERLLELVRAGVASSTCYGAQCDIEVVYVVDNDKEECGHDEKNSPEKNAITNRRNSVATHAASCIAINRGNRSKIERGHIQRLIDGKIKKCISNQTSRLSFGLRRQKFIMK